MSAIVYIANTNILELRGLKSVEDDAFINNNTNVKLTVVKDAAGEPVAGEAWPVTMDYITDSEGVYQAILDEALALVSGKTYTAMVDVDGGVGRKGHWELSFQARRRIK